MPPAMGSSLKKMMIFGPRSAGAFSGIEMYLGDLASCVADTMIGVLGLEDGTRVEGTGFGAPGMVSGELVFTTIMSGYEEALTDPSYHGQMLMFTYPLQGNYGVSGDDFQSDRMWPKAMVSREYWDRPTHHRSAKTLNQFLTDEGKPGLCGVDTRMLTLKVRTAGRDESYIWPSARRKRCQIWMWWTWPGPSRISRRLIC